VSNRSDHSYKDIVLKGLTLGKIEPREQSSLPIKIAALVPGAEHKFDLHYDGLTWLGDELSADELSPQ
jgi:hypothetical protein